MTRTMLARCALPWTLVAAAACGRAIGGAGTGLDDAPGPSDPDAVGDGNGFGDAGTDGDGGNPDAMTGGDGGGGADAMTGGDGGGGGTGVVPVVPCTTPVVTTGPLPTGVNFGQTGDPGPLMARDARAFVFLEGSTLWTIAQAGSASTVARPAELANATSLGAFASVSGRSAVTYLRQSMPRARSFDGMTWGAERTLPCTQMGLACSVRAATDGHLWVYTNSAFHEDSGGTFVNRGGGPALPLYWDVDRTGAVVLLAAGATGSGDKLVVWKLAAGAAGWTRVGALRDTDVAGVEPSIEGGFRFGTAGPGTIAPDGSIHLFSDSRCIGTGDRNKGQAYARSRDGITWSVELLPAATTLHAGNLTWHHSSFWASDYENARFVVTSSVAPTFDGFQWQYPDRRFDVVGRCLDPAATPTFGLLATTRLRGWTTRGYTRFSETGAASLLTDEGLTQTQ